MTADKSLKLCNFFLNIEKHSENQSLVNYAKRQQRKYWQMHLYKISN